MPEQSPTNANEQPQIIRLDPSPSKVFSWLSYDPDAPAVLDDNGRTLRPAGPTLTVRYRFNGSEFEFFPVSFEECQAVFNPGAIYDYSIGKAFGSIIKSHKSSRKISSGERQSTKAQREQEEKREGRRWLA